MSEISIEAPQLADPGRLFIGGAWIEPSTSNRIRVVSPITEEVFAEVAEAVEADIDKAVRAARVAFDTGPWPRMAPAERAAKLRAMSAALHRRSADAARAWTTQIGVPLWMAELSSPSIIGIIDYYADLIDGYAFEEVRPTRAHGFEVAIVTKEAVGVVAAVAPWNAPLAAMLQKIAPALAAGCTVIAKPAPESPIEAFLLAEAAQEAGLPEGVFNLAPADRAASDYLIRHHDVDKVSFTGSTAVGRHIAEVCGSRLARATMELGGKSPAIVLDDMDPATLGAMLAPAITLMSGQVCANFTRVLVPRSRARDYTEALADAMASTNVGNPLEAGVMMGPLAMKRQLDRVEGYIAQGQAEGARIATGGKRPSHLNRGFFLEPTLFSDMTNDMVVAREEIFGPVAGVIAYDDVEDAVRIANDTIFGLSGGVFTNDTDRAYAVARQIRTGNISQNGRGLDTAIPFGGFKQSGYGREGGREGLEPYLEVKSIFLPKVPTHLAWSVGETGLGISLFDQRSFHGQG